MEYLYSLVVIITGLPLAIVGLIYGASKLGGEVVTLQRANSEGTHSDVRIWIVSQGDTAWIEHGDKQTQWINLLTTSPRLKLTRQGETRDYLAAPDPDSHAIYHELRQRKYGWADSLIALLTGASSDCAGVPVRLELLH